MKFLFISKAQVNCFLFDQDLSFHVGKLHIHITKVGAGLCDQEQFQGVFFFLRLNSIQGFLTDTAY